MIHTWWWLWIVMMFMFVLFPTGYGWGYRGWGPPYPRYVQRRRGLRALAPGTSPSFDHSAWGRGGDLVWMVFAIGMIWVVAATWWR
jgi:hypothetical protein